MSDFQLTIFLVDGTCDYIQTQGDLADVLGDLRRFGSIMSNGVWYPLHAILKIKVGWPASMNLHGDEESVPVPDEQWARVEKVMDDFKAQRKKRRRRLVSAARKGCFPSAAPAAIKLTSSAPSPLPIVVSGRLQS